MNAPFLCRNWIRSRGLSLLLSLIFLLFVSSCAHPPSKANLPAADGGMLSPAGSLQTATDPPAESPWWKKPENEWLIAALIVLGIGIAIGAGIFIASGAGGLKIKIAK